VIEGDRRTRAGIPAAALAGMPGFAALALRVIAPVLTCLLTLLARARIRQVIARIIPVKYAENLLEGDVVGMPSCDCRHA
jgi:hypothetical protein